MSMKDVIRSWFAPVQIGGVKTPSVQPAEPTASVEVEPKETTVESAMPEREFVPPVVKELSLYEDARAKFNAADELEMRSAVLVQHPFFQNGKNLVQLDATFFLDVLTHMTVAMKDKGSQFFGGDYFDDAKIRHHMYKMAREGSRFTCYVLQWGSSDNFMQWQTRATELAQENPALAGSLLDAVSKHLATSSCVGAPSVAWLDCVEKLSSNQPHVTHDMVLHNFYKAFTEHSNADKCMAAYPALYKQWLDPNNDDRTMTWATQRVARAAWLAQHHPRIDVWDVAEWYHVANHTQKKPDIMQALSENAPSGALLKAWYGVELTTEEMTKHPLAHSLYVHKHAAMYHEEVQPLPGSWEMALALATTGRQFCETLVMAAKMDTSKEKPLALELPDLGPTP